jgi:type I restriction enzyme S subunit
MEVKPGYRHTEVGVIPEDWNLRQLGDVVTFLDGRRRPVKDADRAKMRGPIPYYGASGIVDYVNDYLFDEDLILLGEDGENILSRNCRLAFRISGKAWVNNHAHVLKPNPDISIGFLTDYLESLNYERFNSGTAQPKLNKQTCFGIPVALPPTKAEQETIAEALSDADAFIESLEQLLAKKRNLKQGAMQELLTGKKRLPGFSGEWEVKGLGEIADVKTGPFGSSLHESDYVRDGTPIITVEHLGEFGVTHFNLPLVSDSDRQRLRAYSLEIGDIVFSRVGSIDRNALIRPDEEGWLFSGRLLRVRPDRQRAFAPFLSYQFHGEGFKGLVRNVAVGQTMASLNTQILKGIAPSCYPATANKSLSPPSSPIWTRKSLRWQQNSPKPASSSRAWCRNCSPGGSGWYERCRPT